MLDNHGYPSNVIFLENPLNHISTRTLSAPAIAANDLTPVAPSVGWPLKREQGETPTTPSPPLTLVASHQAPEITQRGWDTCSGAVGRLRPEVLNGAPVGRAVTSCTPLIRWHGFRPSSLEP